MCGVKRRVMSLLSAPVLTASYGWLGQAAEGSALHPRAHRAEPSSKGFARLAARLRFCHHPTAVNLGREKQTAISSCLPASDHPQVVRRGIWPRKRS